MLKIGYGCPENAMFYIDAEFEEVFEAGWLKNERNLRILHDIDNCHISPIGLQDNDNENITFSIYEISTGSKALMICNMLDDVEIWGTIFGDNCTDLLLEIAEEKDVTIYIQHFINFNENKFKAYSLVKKREYLNYREFELESVSEVIEDAIKY